MSVRVFEVDFQVALDILKFWRRSQQKYQADYEQLASLDSNPCQLYHVAAGMRMSFSFSSSNCGPSPYCG
jgi:hypothetical protein